MGSCFQCFLIFLIYSSLHYIYSISLFYFHLIMTFWKRRNVVPCFIIFYRRFLSSIKVLKEQCRLSFIYNWIGDIRQTLSHWGTTKVLDKF